MKKEMRKNFFLWSLPEGFQIEPPMHQMNTLWRKVLVNRRDSVPSWFWCIVDDYNSSSKFSGSTHSTFWLSQPRTNLLVHGGYDIWELGTFQKIVEKPLQKCSRGGISVCVWKYRCIGTSRCAALGDWDTSRWVWLRYIFKHLQNRWKSFILAMSSTLMSSHTIRRLSIAEGSGFPIIPRYVLKVPHHNPTREATFRGFLACSICWFSMIFRWFFEGSQLLCEGKTMANPIFRIQTMPSVRNEWKWSSIIHHHQKHARKRYFIWKSFLKKSTC